MIGFYFLATQIGFKKIKDCYICKGNIYHDDFIYHNEECESNENLEKIWNSKHVQLLCCRCAFLLNLFKNPNYCFNRVEKTTLLTKTHNYSYMLVEDIFSVVLEENNEFIIIFDNTMRDKTIAKGYRYFCSKKTIDGLKERGYLDSDLRML